MDSTRIACTGASGGGLNTLFAAALDERIQVAVPVVFVTRARELLETRHTHCPCSHVNGLLEFMDFGDVAALIAPRPLLCVTASRDPEFLPAGAFAAAEQAAPAYQLLGVADRLEVREIDSGHDYNQPMREELYAWLERFGFGTRRAEPELETEADLAVLNCFPAGHLPDGGETMRSLVAARAVRLLAAAPASPEQALSKLKELVRPSGEDLPMRLLADPGIVALRKTVLGSGQGLPVLYRSAQGFDLAGMRFGGTSPEGPLLVVLGSSARPSELDPGLLESVRANSAWWLLVDPRGSVGGRDEHLLATDSLLLGDPLAARRARALAGLLQSLRAEQADSRPLVILATDLRSSLIALLALGSTRGGADGLALIGLPDSLLDLFGKPLPPRDAVAWKLLEIGDLDLWESAAGVPVVRLEGPAWEPGLKSLLEML